MFKKSEKFIDPSVFEKQLHFAVNLIPALMKEVESFEYCALHILKKEVLYRLFDACDSADAAELLYDMSNSKTFSMHAIQTKSYDTFDVITTFDNDFEVDYAFGKADKERVEPLYERSPTARKRRARC